LPKAQINSWKLQTKGKNLLDYRYNLKEKLPMTKRLLVDWQLARPTQVRILGSYLEQSNKVFLHFILTLEDKMKALGKNIDTRSLIKKMSTLGQKE
jgi:hypothetical protein